MSRDLPVLVESEIEGQQLYTFHLVEFQFDSGTLRFTTLNRNIDFGGNTYGATPDFLSFGNVVESETVEVGSMEFTLSSVDLTVVAQALTEDFTDRPILLYRAFLDRSTYQLIVDPYLIYEGRVTGFTLSENIDQSTSNLVWASASIWSDFQRTAGRRSNHNDQQVFYPGDMAFEYGHSIDFSLKWGRV